MRPFPIILVLISAVFAPGCSGSKYYQEGVEPTDLSTVQRGTSRQVIEELLGQPVESESDGDRQVDTYEYNRGRPVDLSKTGPLFTSSGGGGFVGVIVFVGVEAIHQGYKSIAAGADFKKQKGRVKITFAADDIAIAVEVLEPESEDGRFQLGQTTRADVMIIMGEEPSLILRGGVVLVYSETPKTFLIIEFDGDVVDAATTTTACIYSGICVIRAENKKHPPVVYARPGEDAMARDFNAKPEQGCAIYAYSDIQFKDGLIDLQEVTLDQQPAGILHRSGYLWWLVEEGVHELEVLGATLDSKKHSPRLEIDCQPGKAYFIRTRTTIWSLWSSAPGYSKRVPKYLEQVGESKGRKEIGKRRLLMDSLAFPARLDEFPVGP